MMRIWPRPNAKNPTNKSPLQFIETSSNVSSTVQRKISGMRTSVTLIRSRLSILACIERRRDNDDDEIVSLSRVNTRTRVDFATVIDDAAAVDATQCTHSRSNKFNLCRRETLPTGSWYYLSAGIDYAVRKRTNVTALWWADVVQPNLIRK